MPKARRFVRLQPTKALTLLTVCSDFRFASRQRESTPTSPFVEESYFVIMCGIIGLLLADEDTCVSR